jgi:hypothetical protein
MINVQCPLIVEHWTFCILHLSLAVLSSRLDTAGGDRQQFVTLPEHRSQLIVRGEAQLGYEFEPSTCLTQFLHANAQLVNEIPPGFRSLHLARVGEWGGAASDHLDSDVLADRSRRKARRQATNASGETDETILEVVARRTHAPQSWTTAKPRTRQNSTRAGSETFNAQHSRHGALSI